MTDAKLALVRHRLSQADDSIREAQVLLSQGMSARSVANRLYYAMFYAVLALLQELDMGTSKHSGAIAHFDREFIKTGRLPSRMSKTLHRAFDLRQRADYMEQADISIADIEELLPEAIEFVSACRKHLLKD